MTERGKQKRPRREPWALNAKNRLFKGDSAGIIDVGGHLPSAESAGVAAVAAAGQNAGPVLELDLVAVLKLEKIGRGAFKGDSKIFCTLIGGEIFLFRVNSDQIACVVLLGVAGVLQ